MNSFIDSEIGYCPLVWSFSSRAVLKKIDSIFEKSFNLVNRSASDEMVPSAHTHYCNLLLKEIFKTQLKLNPSYMQEVFKFRENICYDLRHGSSITQNRIFTTHYGLNNVTHIGGNLWDSLPPSVKASPSLDTFAANLSELPSLNCKCRLCATYVAGVGYID